MSVKDSLVQQRQKNKDSKFKTIGQIPYDDLQPEIQQCDFPAFEVLTLRVASGENGHCVNIVYCVSLLSMTGLFKMAIIVTFITFANTSYALLYFFKSIPNLILKLLCFAAYCGLQFKMMLLKIKIQLVKLSTNKLYGGYTCFTSIL